MVQPSVFCPTVVRAKLPSFFSLSTPEPFCQWEDGEEASYSFLIILQEVKNTIFQERGQSYVCPSSPTGLWLVTISVRFGPWLAWIQALNHSVQSMLISRIQHFLLITTKLSWFSPHIWAYCLQGGRIICGERTWTQGWGLRLGGLRTSTCYMSTSLTVITYRMGIAPATFWVALKIKGNNRKSI